MANRIFRIDKKNIFIDALLCQPTNWCRLSCKDCYVKAEAYAGQIPKDVWVNLVSKFLLNPEYSTNQVSVSLDNLPTDHKQRQYMVSLAKDMLTIASRRPAVQSGTASRELHFTAHSPDTISEYLSEGIELEEFANLNVLTLSNVWNDQYILPKLRSLGVLINWNILPDRISPSSVNVCERYIDMSYGLINKKQAFSLTCMESFESKLTNIVRQNYRRDSCWTDINKGYCGANISKFTIWPDGSVTGCPYSKICATPPTFTLSGILDNIVLASTRFDFEQCPLKGTCHVN
jgi:hypothetical protein